MTRQKIRAAECLVKTDNVSQAPDVFCVDNYWQFTLHFSIL